MGGAADAGEGARVAFARGGGSEDFGPVAGGVSQGANLVHAEVAAAVEDLGGLSRRKLGDVGRGPHLVPPEVGGGGAAAGFGGCGLVGCRARDGPRLWAKGSWCLENVR